MKIYQYRIALAGLAMIGLAGAVAAQGPGFRGLESFAGRFGLRSVAGEPFQAAFTSTRIENAVVNGAASQITTTTSGTLARDAAGDTYEDVTLPGSGSNASTEHIFIKSLSAMENYSINVTKQTYQQFALRAFKGGGNRSAGTRPNAVANANRPTPTALSYTVPGSSYTCAAEEVKLSRTIQPPSGQGGGNPNPSITITSDRIYCPALHEVLMETHSDPRSGSTTMQLSGLTLSPTVSFAVPSGYTLEPSPQFGRRGGN